MSISLSNKIAAAAAAGLISAACGGSQAPAADAGEAAGDATMEKEGCKGEEGCEHKGECKGEAAAEGDKGEDASCKGEGECKGEESCEGHAPE